jgi:hypothetical protein
MWTIQVSSLFIDKSTAARAAQLDRNTDAAGAIPAD